MCVLDRPATKSSSSSWPTHLDHELRGWVHRGCCLPGPELLALAGQLAHEAEQLQLLLPVCDGQLRGFAQMSQEQAR